jgi:hypothetical protein
MPARPAIDGFAGRGGYTQGTRRILNAGPD